MTWPMPHSLTICRSDEMLVPRAIVGDESRMPVRDVNRAGLDGFEGMRAHTVVCDHGEGGTQGTRKVSHEGYLKCGGIPAMMMWGER